MCVSEIDYHEHELSHPYALYMICYAMYTYGILSMPATNLGLKTDILIFLMKRKTSVPVGTLCKKYYASPLHGRAQSD